jgi:ADP-ribosylglycohydrolase
MTHRADAILGCLYGMAFGDALAAPVEFSSSVKAIVEQYPPNGPDNLTGNPALVTDDTQMALAVGEALMMATKPYTLAAVSPALEKTFIEWMHSPDNNRAPGMTCMRSIGAMENRGYWLMTTDMESKGCGANMRVQPVGLLNVDSFTRRGIAQLQAAITHAHPTALAASDLTAWVIADQLAGGEVQSLLSRVLLYIRSQKDQYHENWLGELWKRSKRPSPEEYINRGWNDCLYAVERVEKALTFNDHETDPCVYTGAGWIAEEAFATALYCFLLYPDEPRRMLTRAAVTSGDSDSIACIAGAFAGARHGKSAFPDDWYERIEYRERIEKLGAFLV